MKEEMFRKKINSILFLFSVFVIWIHSYNAELYLGISSVSAKVDRFEHAIGGGIGQVAVPGFFMISAYLFFRNISWWELWRKWKRRVNTTLIPFLLWNGLYYIGYLVGSRLPYITKLVNKGVVPWSLEEIKKAIFFYQYNYVFWYLYQLILLVLIAPVLYFVLKKIWSGIFFLVLVVVCIRFKFSLFQLNTDALLYYCISGFCALHGKKLAEAQWSIPRARAGFFLLMSALGLFGMSELIVDGGNVVIFTVVGRLLVPPAIWLMLNEEKLPAVKPWMKDTFFLYGIHFALVRLINKAGAEVLYDIWIVPVILYSVMPVVVVYISYVTGKLLKEKLPLIWRLLNGGR